MKKITMEGLITILKLIRFADMTTSVDTELNLGKVHITDVRICQTKSDSRTKIDQHLILGTHMNTNSLDSIRIDMKTIFMKGEKELNISNNFHDIVQRCSFTSSEIQTVSSEDSDDTNSYENSRHFYGLTQQKKTYQHTINKKQTKSRKRTRTTKVPEDEEKRKNFLERNRLAALKCRQRKKQWLSNLQTRVEYLANDNDQLQLEASLLRKEIMTLKTLLNHKNCKVNHSNSDATASSPVQQMLLAEASTLPPILPYQNAMPPSTNDQFLSTYPAFNDNFRNTMV
ncbi:hypothetical protein K501DRAFT_330105 [Backusella circina FSU 941]|nr:hypothetical protein K501DRAFT_330105 [Backusella circina FSU 941]